MVSDDLRRGSGALLQQRRRVFGLPLASAASLGVVALYQSGILRHLPDPPIGPFGSDTVDASGEAYHYLLTPDAAIGIASYAVTAVLAGMGTRDRASERPWIPLALAGKVASDALGAGFLTLEQISKHRKLCFWCLTAALTSVLRSRPRYPRHDWPGATCAPRAEQLSNAFCGRSEG
jgi:hypothetical protein